MRLLRHSDYCGSLFVDLFLGCHHGGTKRSVGKEVTGTLAGLQPTDLALRGPQQKFAPEDTDVNDQRL